MLDRHRWLLPATLAVAMVGCGDDDTPPLEEEPAELEAATTPEPAPAPEPEPELQQEGEPHYGAIPLSPGFSPDPREQRGTTEGVVAAAALGEDCGGYVTETPLHAIEARGPFARMHLAVVGDTGLGIVLRTAEGQVHCSGLPDSGDPQTLVTHLQPGTHRIWLATAEPDSSVRYVLALSELEIEADSLSAP